jgi:nucleoside-diphosphate-sugar epimerase
MGLADDNFSPTYLRNATAYGVSPRLRFDLFLNNLTAWAFATTKVHLKSDGSAWRPIVHIEDIARAFIAVLKADSKTIHNQVFNVGTENYRVFEIARMVAEVVPNSELQYGVPKDPGCYRVNFDKLTKALPHYQPQWTARKGIEQCYAAYREYGVTLEDFEGPRYQRLAHIKMLIEKRSIGKDLRFTPSPIAVA